MLSLNEMRSDGNEDQASRVFCATKLLPSLVSSFVVSLNANSFLISLQNSCSQLWLLVLILVINGVSAGMSLIPTFPEILSCA